VEPPAQRARRRTTARRRRDRSTRRRRAAAAAAAGGTGGYVSPLAGWTPSWGGSGGTAGAPPPTGTPPTGTPPSGPTGATPGATPSTPSAPNYGTNGYFGGPGPYQFQPGERGADTAAVVRQLLGDRQALTPAGQQAAQQQAAQRIQEYNAAAGMTPGGDPIPGATRPDFVASPKASDARGVDDFDKAWTWEQAGYTYDPARGGYVSPRAGIPQPPAPVAGPPDTRTSAQKASAAQAAAALQARAPKAGSPEWARQLQADYETASEAGNAAWVDDLRRAAQPYGVRLA
jgi:hypothetical protein